jgi:hypothetical protein
MESSAACIKWLTDFGPHKANSASEHGNLFAARIWRHLRRINRNRKAGDRHALERSTIWQISGKNLPGNNRPRSGLFFWALPKLYGKLAEEAQELARKARAIKPPRRGRRRLAVEYEFDRDRQFNGFEFVDADSPPSRWCIRLPYLDLRRPLRRKYDKRAGLIMLRDFRRRYFGKHKRLTKERCEEFFSNDANFIDI